MSFFEGIEFWQTQNELILKTINGIKTTDFVGSYTLLFY